LEGTFKTVAPWAGGEIKGATIVTVDRLKKSLNDSKPSFLNLFPIYFINLVSPADTSKTKSTASAKTPKQWHVTEKKRVLTSFKKTRSRRHEANENAPTRRFFDQRRTTRFITWTTATSSSANTSARAILAIIPLQIKTDQNRQTQQFEQNRNAFFL
jgi:hypothetical protein